MTQKLEEVVLIRALVIGRQTNLLLRHSVFTIELLGKRSQGRDYHALQTNKQTKLTLQIPPDFQQQSSSASHQTIHRHCEKTAMVALLQRGPCVPTRTPFKMRLLESHA